MGQNDGEIFTRLREIGEGVVRIDERTQRMDADMREHHADHEVRIRTLERDNDKRKGVMAAIVIGVSAVFQGLVWCIKHFFGGVAS
jgi:hypothetical protein